VGFDFDPKNGDLWLRQRTRLVQRGTANDELNHVTKPGQQHFGFRSAIRATSRPEFGWGKSCDEYVKRLLPGSARGLPGPDVLSRQDVPGQVPGRDFIARHGPWNRTKKYADISVAWPDGKEGARSSLS